MSKSYTPGLKVLDKAIISKERLLPLQGKVHVENNEKVEADKIVASTQIPGNIQMINIANELNIDADQVMDCMLSKVDDSISKGQIIAQSKGIFGMFKSEIKSPLDGILANISEITGQAIISESPIPIEVDAYIPGTVSNIISKEGVTVTSNGCLIQGIIGIGGEKKGLIKVLEEDFNMSLQEKILPTYKDKIIVIPSYLSYDIFKILNKIGVKGIVCGGIDYSSLTKILRRPLGVAITGMEDVSTVIVTEGFGDISMASRTYNLLKQSHDKFASINGATQIRAGVMRPEIFIANKEESDNTAIFDEESLVLSLGSKVRVIREPHFGKIGVVSDLPPKLIKMDTETLARAAEIMFDEDGTKEIIPRTNLEVILSD